MGIASGVSFNTPLYKTFRYPDISYPKTHWHSCAQVRSPQSACDGYLSITT